MKNMTTGTPWKLILLFSIPLLIGNIFQAAYNIVDTAIVGRLLGNYALAGVGIASPVFNFINALLIGLSVGSSIIVSQLFGAKREAELPTAVSTVLITSFALSCILTLLGELLAVPFLTLLKTPTEDFAYAEMYLRTIIAGLICNVFYNQLAGLLRGLGNSKTPLYFLAFSSVLNACLDLFFIAVLHLGVFGAGLATICAEGASALLTAFYIWKKIPYIKHQPGAAFFDKTCFKTVIRFGLPMGLQQASISLGHILIQILINPFGTALIAGYAAATKVDMFAVMPIISLSTAVSTFAAQNAGAGKTERVRRGLRTANVMTVIICAALALSVVPSRVGLIQLFLSPSDTQGLTAAIVSAGASMLSITPLFYIILGMIHSTVNTMAGAGDTKFSMYAMVGMMLSRVVIAWGFTAYTSLGYVGIWWAFPLSWAITLLFVLAHYFRGSWTKMSLAKAVKSSS